MDHLCRSCGHGWHDPENAAHGLATCRACGSHKVVRHPRLGNLAVAHVDCDAFYASIHKRDDQSLKSKPVIVGGGRRGVVAAACYLARASGVHSAMPMFKALAACPNAVVIKPQMELYSREGRAIRERMAALTPLVMPVSVDEAYLDLSGTERLAGMSPAAQLAKLQREVEREHGLTISVGLSSNRFLAKLASDMDKPNGFAVLAEEDMPALLWRRPVTALHGIGPALARTMEKAGLRTVGDLARADPRRMADKLGPDALRWIDLANGRDRRPVSPEHERKSVSAETTFGDDTGDPVRLGAILQDLCEEVGRRARAEGCGGRSVTLKLKTSRFRIITRRVTLGEPTATGRVMLGAVRPLLAECLDQGPFRLLGVGIADLSPLDAADRGDLMDTSAPKLAALERALDSVNLRYGRGTVRSGAASKPKRDSAEAPSTD